MGKIDNTNCTVSGCNSRKKYEPNLHFHRFPESNSGTVNFTNRFGIIERIERRKAWAIKLNIEQPGKGMQVCSKHFTQDDYFPTQKSVRRINRKLKRIAVPSINLPPILLPKTENLTVTSKSVIQDTEEEPVENVDKIPMFESCFIRDEVIHDEYSSEDGDNQYGDRDQHFKCQHCNETFLLQTQLEEHLVIHTEKNVFECGNCYKKFSHISKLNQHVLNHCDEKWFECDQCSKKFTQIYNFKTHLLTHTEK